MAITYKEAGVDIDAGESLVERIKPIARSVQSDLVLNGLGGFAGLLRMPSGMKEPVLVSGTDGVGTKLDVALALGRHETIGIDLVAMCVNDIVTVGARPLLFLDYFATGKLDVSVGEDVIRGVAEGCRQANCALLGGETAEMPGMYDGGKYDLAGFAVGVVERGDIIDGNSCVPGDVVLGVASSGLHSNGYSLVRHVMQRRGLSWDHQPDGFAEPLGPTLLHPTRIYARAVQTLLENLPRGTVHALAHITGGGIGGNLSRVLPDGLVAQVELGTYQRPAVFTWIGSQGPVSETELRRTFNLGVGLCVVVAADVAPQAIGWLEKAGERAWKLGQLVLAPSGSLGEAPVQFIGGAR